MTKAELKLLAAQIMKVVVTQDGEMVLTQKNKFTKRELETLNNILNRYNVIVDFNQIYDEKRDDIFVDKKTLLIGIDTY